MFNLKRINLIFEKDLKKFRYHGLLSLVGYSQFRKRKKYKCIGCIFRFESKRTTATTASTSSSTTTASK